MRTLAIDWDGTWTADPYLFSRLAALAEELDWHVVIVTNRHAHEPIGDALARPPLSMPVVYCAGAPKRAVMAARGIAVDVWVDDMPVLVDFGQAGLERLARG